MMKTRQRLSSPSLITSRRKNATCLFCSKKCNDNQFGDKVLVPGAVHCQNLKRQLEKYFILRKILNLESIWCEQALWRSSSNLEDKTDGDGKGFMMMESWFRTCDGCLKLVEKAWLLHQQILALEAKFNQIKVQLRNKMRERILEERKSMGYHFTGPGMEANISCEVFPDLTGKIETGTESESETKLENTLPLLPEPEISLEESDDVVSLQQYSDFEPAEDEGEDLENLSDESYNLEDDDDDNHRKKRKRKRSSVTAFRSETVRKSGQRQRCGRPKGWKPGEGLSYANFYMDSNPEEPETIYLDCDSNDNTTATALPGSELELAPGENPESIKSAKDEDSSSIAKTQWKRRGRRSILGRRPWRRKPLGSSISLQKRPRKKPGRKPNKSNANSELYVSKYYGEIKQKKFNWKYCPECKAKFKEDYDFDKHLDLHEKRKQSEEQSHLNCTVCSYPAEDTVELEQHLQNRHKLGVEPRKLWSCPESSCSFKARAFKALKLHVDREHPSMKQQANPSQDNSEGGGDLVAPSEKNEFLLQCPHCPEKFSDARKFFQHKRNSHPEALQKSYECPQCSKKLSSKFHLESHVARIHQGKSRFFCEVCGAGYQFLRHLRHHWQEKHSGNPTAKFVCDLCGLDYTTHAMLRKHSLKFHPEQNEHDKSSGASSLPLLQCKYCDLTSPYKVVLQRHLQTHKEELGHKCEICSRCYTSDQGLRRHLRINHPEKKEQIPCPYCGNLYQSIDYMKDHLNKYCNKKKQQDKIFELKPTPPIDPLLSEGDGIRISSKIKL